MPHLDTFGNFFDHAEPADLEEVFNLFRRDLAREPNEVLVARLTSMNLVQVARTPSGELVGFAYLVPGSMQGDAGSLPSDVVELRNILVAHGRRSGGIGSGLLSEAHERATKDYNAIILYNSFLYINADNKRDPTNFYSRHGYTPVSLTEATKFFYKPLP